MKKFTNHRIPTLLAMFLLLVGVGVSLLLLKQGVFYIGKAAPDATPQNITITNISDSSFTVVFTTTLKTEAIIALRDAKVGQSIILDDRDKSTGMQNKYFSHHLTVPNLQSNKQYAFSIISGGKEFGVKNAYTASTGSVINSAPPTQDPLYGTVLLPDSSIGTDVLVMVKNSESQTVSAITNGKGSFIIPMNSLRTTSFDAYSLLNPDTQFTITAFREDAKANISTTYALAQSLPPITLSQEYNFTQSQEPTASIASELKIPFTISSLQKLSVIKPTDNQSFIDTKPEFRGTAYPNAKVTIKIKNFVTTTIQANASGLWTYRSDNPLSPDTHELSVESADNVGKIERITRSFVIFPSGSQIAASATPSATPSIQPSPTPTNTPSPTTPTITQGVTPTITTAPTPTPTLTPAITASPTATVAPTTAVLTTTPAPTLAKPGGTSSTIALSILSIVFIVAGAGLLFIL